MRLFLNDPRIVSCPTRVHEHLKVEGPSLVLYDRWIEHYNLALSSRAEREMKCRRYNDLRPDHDVSYYLYEDKNFTLAPLTTTAAAAAQIAYLGMPRSRRFVVYEPGSEIDFRSGGNSVHYTLAGWSEPENWGTWTVNGQAELRLPIEEPMGRGAILVAVVQPFIHPRHPVSRVEVRYFGELIDEWSLDDGNPTEKQISVPASLIARDRSPAFVFRTLNPISPLDLDESNDPRRLSLGFVSLRMVPGRY
jgi:hypothetical protein